MVGLGAVAGARLQGAERIICVDLSEDRLELAKGQGATDTWIGGADTVQRVLDETGGFGADYTFEATGIVDGHAPGRRVRAHGLGPVHGRRRGRQGRDARHRPALPDHRPARRGLVASAASRAATRCPQLVQRYLDGELDVDPFISHRITLDEVNHGFELMHDQDGIRSVIEF